MQVLTKALITKSEKDAVDSGTFSFCELMHIAGTTAAKIITQKFECKHKKIAILCGNGNNGGDGFVIARYLYEYGFDVTVIMPCGKPITENANFYYKKLMGVKIADSFTENSYDIIIDAVFGIGLNRNIEGELKELFIKINNEKAIRIAVDIPSGVECDSGRVLGVAFNADFTITFISLKPCFVLPFGSDYCGEVAVADIGVTPDNSDYSTIEEPIFQKRLHNTHKGNYGTALMLNGSYGMAGAAILASKAALRSGVGIAKCVICEGIYPAFTSTIPEAVCIPTKESPKGTFNDNIDLESALNGSTALLFGCGVGKGKEIELLLKKIIEKSEIPIVLDADGINALANNIDILKKSKAPIIITPHPAEMARLCKITTAEVEADRISIALNFAKENNCIVVLKGANTIVAAPNGDISFNILGNPGMTKGGCGDVLAGVVVSLLAQGISPLEATKAAVYLHSAAGDKAALRKGERAMLPSDIIEEL